MKRIAVTVIALLSLAGMVGFFASHPSGPASTGGVTGSASLAAGAAAPSPAGAPGEKAGGVFASAGRAPAGVTTMTSESAPVPQIGPDIVKTGAVSIQVKKGGFQDAFQSASMVAARYGGFVESSSAVNDRSGWLQIRVPAASFEQAMADLRQLGKVRGQSISGQDVTSQFVDLGARLITWKSQEEVLLRLMSKATTIGDTLRIQNELQSVQVRIEQIQGELRVLRNQTALATIQVALREPGVSVTPVKPSKAPSLARAWSLAVAGFVGVLSSVVVGLGYLIPIGMIAGIGWLIYRRVAGPRATVSP